jgi:hypothetical protein
MPLPVATTAEPLLWQQAKCCHFRWGTEQQGRHDSGVDAFWNAVWANDGDRLLLWLRLWLLLLLLLLLLSLLRRAVAHAQSAHVASAHRVARLRARQSW